VFMLGYNLSAQSAAGRRPCSANQVSCWWRVGGGWPIPAARVHWVKLHPGSGHLGDEEAAHGAHIRCHSESRSSTYPVLRPPSPHVDYPTRIQTVHEETNPRYYALLEQFRRWSGCAVLVSTSFSVRGEPVLFLMIRSGRRAGFCGFALLPLRRGSRVSSNGVRGY
jgi:hypothetical protein